MEITVSNDGIALEDDTLAGLESGDLACGILCQQVWGDLTRGNLYIDPSILSSDEDLGKLRVLVSVDLEHHDEKEGDAHEQHRSSKQTRSSTKLFGMLRSHAHAGHGKWPDFSCVLRTTLRSQAHKSVPHHLMQFIKPAPFRLGAKPIMVKISHTSNFISLHCTNNIPLHKICSSTPLTWHSTQHPTNTTTLLHLRHY